MGQKGELLEALIIRVRATIFPHKEDAFVSWMLGHTPSRRQFLRAGEMFNALLPQCHQQAPCISMNGEAMYLYILLPVTLP